MTRRIAIVHDFLYCYGGAERVLEQILNLFPDADLFSLFDFLPEYERGFIHNKPVKTTFIQHLPLSRRNHRHFLPFMPLAIEQLDVSDYEVVISSSYLAAKGVIIRPDQLHICYCHSPIRSAWDMQHQYLKMAGLDRGLRSWLTRYILHRIRLWDVRSANSVDTFVTNSHFVARRVQKTYRRHSHVIYPPVDVERFALRADKEDFYLTVSRMVPYKRVDLVIEAFIRMPDRQLVVVGDGPDFRKISKAAKAHPNIRFLGFQSSNLVIDYMQRARAFIFAAEEDFGIVAAEAQACGTPVIAFGRGGSTETVLDGETGILFPEQTPESLIRAVGQFENGHPPWDCNVIRRNAERFSVQRFRDQFQSFLEDHWQAFVTKLDDDKKRSHAVASDDTALADTLARVGPREDRVPVAVAED